MNKINKTAGWLVMAAALTMGMTACSQDDNITDEPNTTTDAPKTYTMTVEATKGADDSATRALSLDGTTLNATWTAGDEVQVYHVSDPGTPSEMESTTPDATLTAQGSGATTTLSGSFSGSYTPAEGDVLRLKFLPNPDYAHQGGTLDYIAANCDYAIATVTITDVTDGNVTTTAASFANQQAIVKFSLKQNDGTTPIAVMRLTVKYGSSTYNVTPASAASDIYVAMHQKSDKAVTLTAIDTDGDSFSYTKSVVSFEKGKYYSIGVKMTEDHPYTATVDLSTLTGDYTVPDGYTILTGTLSGGHKISIADGANVKLRDVTIPGGNDDGKPWAGLTCLGDATIRLSGTNSVKGYHHYYAGIQAGPSGKTLTIDGGGKLTAIRGGGGTGEHGAGIGGGQNQVVGNIVIKGGDITAEGTNAAGIGSGLAQNTTAGCGNITISGGIISAKSNSDGAGIGSGRGTSTYYSYCGDITITGGTITATGGSGGAGIGSGFSSGNGGARCGNITISGGNITATGGSVTASTLKTGGAGIGTGTQARCGSITISGTATGTATHGENNYNTCYDIGTGYLGVLNGSISVAPGTISGTYPAE